MSDQTQAIQQANGTKPKLSDLRVRPGHGIVIETVRDLYNFAVFAAGQGLVPDSFKSRGGEWNIGAITIALIKGTELGLKATQSLQSIYVVNNQPAVWGDALPGLVLASGQMEDFREWFEGQPFEDDFTAVCVTKRKGLKSERVTRYTVADAKTAELWGKNTWKKHPRRMLEVRARAYNMRGSFADVLKGLGVVEELQDYADVQVVEEREFDSRQDEMLHQLRGGNEEPEPQTASNEPQSEPQTDLPPEPTPDEEEEIRQREMAEAGLFPEGGDDA